MEQVGRIGEILARRGLLTQEQVDQILARQRELQLPFGQLARSMFGITDESLWRAWAEQILPFLPVVDLSVWPSTPEALATVKMPHALRYHILPLRIDEGVLRLAISRAQFADAIAWTNEELAFPLDFVMADAGKLDAAIRQRYRHRTGKDASEQAA